MEEQFQKYAVGYYAYITSYEYNYNEMGEPLSGTLSFAEYLENPSLYGIGGTNQGALLWIGVGSFLVISAFILAFVHYKKARKKA